jgi:2-oxoglutarate ferredoxin oxidoreductase subunit gamma
MFERVLIAGAGGQGIVLVGRLLATVAMQHAPFVTFFPAYGAEVRGGTSNCQLVWSDSPIASPVCAEFDSVLAMNQESLDRFAARLCQHGLLVVNASLCATPRVAGVVGVEATSRAVAIGDVRVANFVLLGAYLARRPLGSLASAEGEIRRFLSGRDPRLIEMNVCALREGFTA